jgi:hypothetical protein
MHSSAIEFKRSATPHRESASWAVAEIEALLALDPHVSKLLVARTAPVVGENVITLKPRVSQVLA